MNFKRNLKIVQILFFASVLFSCISFLNKKIGVDEIYPFFYWKLYTQPLGNTYSYKNYRVYGVHKNDTIRIPNKGYYNLNKDDYYYFLFYEAKKIINKEKPIAYYKTRLKDFGQMLHPNFPEYLLIEEKFNPIEIARDSLNFETTIILSSK